MSLHSSSLPNNDSHGILGNPDPREVRIKNAAAEDEFTPRDLDLLQHMADGKGFREVAAATGLAEDTVKTRIYVLRQKVAAPTSINLVAIALRRGLID